MMVKRIALWMGLALCLLAAGCIKKDYKFVLNEDGSGSLRVRHIVDGDLLVDMQRTKDVFHRPMTRFNQAILLTEEEIRELGEEEGVDVSNVSLRTNEDGERVVEFELAFDSISTFAATAGPKIFPFQLNQLPDGTVEFLPDDILDRESIRQILPARGSLNHDQDQVESNLAMMRMHLRGAEYRLEAQFPGKVAEVTHGTAEANNAVWSLTAKDLTLDNLYDDDGDPQSLRAVFAGDDINFDLPVKAEIPRRHHPTHSFEQPAEDWEEVPLVERDPEEREAEYFLFEPANLSASMNISADQSARRHSNATLTLRVLPPPGVLTVAYANLKVDQAVAGDGTDLAAKLDGHYGREHAVNVPHSAIMGEEFGPHPFTIRIPLDERVIEADRIAKLKGSIELKCSTQSRTAKASPVAEWNGKAIPVPGEDDLNVVLEEYTDDSVSLRYEKPAYERKVWIAFLTAEGEKISPTGRSGSGGGGIMTETYEVSLPEDGTVEVVFYSEPYREIVPFEIRDLILNEDALPAAPLDEEGIVEVALKNISVSRNVQLNRGPTPHQNTSANLQISLDSTGEILPISAKRFAVTEAISTEGDPLNIKFRALSHSQNIRTRGGPRSNTFRLRVTLLDAPPNLRSLQRLAGTFELTYAPSVKKAAASPVRDWIGKPLAVPGNEDLDITILSVDEEKTRIRFGKNSEQFVKDIVFEDGDGQQLSRHSISRRGHNGFHQTKQYRVALPEDGAVIFHLYEDIRERTIAFDFSDLDLAK